MTVACLVLIGVLTIEQQDTSATARIIVLLPPEAILFVDDLESSQTGDVRILRSPPLEPGHTYSYSLRVDVPSAGKVTSMRKKVSFRAGDTVTVAFREANARRESPERRTKHAARPTGRRTQEIVRLEQALVDLTNLERGNAGLSPLQPEQRLAKAARDHSVNMARQQKMNHVLDDKGPVERARDAGHGGFGIGENIAYGQRSPTEAIEVWMKSPGHRANILGRQYTHIGIGIAFDENGIPYYTQVFGTAR
ncbi:MAG: TIGR03000 domain-containing protein [Planctomycetes bacterium]|nr:TIGR03000 domain-containing protein [Planctomycetota bacterium]